MSQLWAAPWWRVRTGEYAAHKAEAIAAYRSQITNLTGEPGWSYLSPAFVSVFLGRDELFLPVLSDAAVQCPRRLKTFIRRGQTDIAVRGRI